MVRINLFPSFQHRRSDCGRLPKTIEISKYVHNFYLKATSMQTIYVIPVIKSNIKNCSMIINTGWHGEEIRYILFSLKLKSPSPISPWANFQLPNLTYAGSGNKADFLLSQCKILHSWNRSTPLLCTWVTGILQRLWEVSSPIGTSHLFL